MGERWKSVSAGAVTLRIFPGGIEGPERTMLRKVALGQMQAVALSSAGLAEIDTGVSSLSIPMLFESYAELDYARERLEPQLERRIEARGYIVLNWSDVGWVHFFTKEPARSLDDIRKMRLFVSAGDPDTEAIYKKFGFNVIPSEVTAMVEALRTNRINAFDVPPLFALLDQSFALARNMIDVKRAPVVAATLIHKRAWEQIPAALQPKLLEAARQAGADYRAQIRKMGDDAIVEMRKRQLNVVHLDAAALASWRREAEAAYPAIRGSIVPADLFDEVQRLVREFRVSTKKQ
jgi:TRAP-type C4-dicarboxylate transport system substrate-binding protein